MADEASDVAQPDWAVGWQERAGGRVIYTDEAGERLVAMAVTRDDLARLESGLQHLPHTEATSGLLSRLAMLRADFDE